MGLPSTNIEAVYRNPIDQVAKFFNKMHKDHYLIANLCSEREYPSEPFHGRVVRFPHDDHNVRRNMKTTEITHHALLANTFS